MSAPERISPGGSEMTARRNFPVVPTQEELDAAERRERVEDRRRMGAVVWVVMTLPAYVVLAYLGLKWMWGV